MLEYVRVLRYNYDKRTFIVVVFNVINAIVMIVYSSMFSFLLISWIIIIILVVAIAISILYNFVLATITVTS